LASQSKPGKSLARKKNRRLNTMLQGPKYSGLPKAKQVIGGKSGHPIGKFQIGKKSHSSKVTQVMGKMK